MLKVFFLIVELILSGPKPPEEPMPLSFVHLVVTMTLHIIFVPMEECGSYLMRRAVVLFLESSTDSMIHSAMWGSNSSGGNTISKNYKCTCTLWPAMWKAIFVNAEVLVWMDSPFCVEYNVKLQEKNHKLIHNHFRYLGSLFQFPGNRKWDCIMKYISEQLITPHNYNSHPTKV